ncbi:hypothetical protein N7455_011793, partial [Penicillium solitum]|uniref:uncharacterized protein n=1 Tax=Penicillium solitum TaxID=60172 RepID=UPI0032C43D60
IADKPNVHDGVPNQQAPISQYRAPRFGAVGTTEETRSLVGQAIGELVDENNCCDSYAKLDGKFANCVRGFRCSFAEDAKEGSKSILRKRGLEAMLEEMSDLYDLEDEALDDIITEKRGLVKAIVEEAEGVGYI